MNYSVAFNAFAAALNLFFFINTNNALSYVNLVCFFVSSFVAVTSWSHA